MSDDIRDRRATLLGLEKRMTWGNVAELLGLVVMATLLYAKFNGAAEAVESLEPRVATLERVYERQHAETKGRFDVLEQQIATVTRDVDLLDRRATARLERLEAKIDRLLIGRPSRTARAEPDE